MRNSFFFSLIFASLVISQVGQALTPLNPQSLLARRLKALPVFNPKPLLTFNPAVTTLNVTLNTDNDPGGTGELGDLRYMLNSMNQGLQTTAHDYAITFATPGTITLNGILPIINNSSNAVNITIGNADPASVITIDGNIGTYPGFFIPMGNVTIQNVNFQNLTAKGGNGGNGISGGGGGVGAGGAIYAPQTFLNGSNPSVTLINVLIDSCSAVGGNGGSYFSLSSPTGDEGGGGGGGFGGNGGSITTTGSCGGAGGGGFGGDGGNVTLSTSDPFGGGGGGGGGLGSRATIGTLTNLGNGGSDQTSGLNGNARSLAIIAGTGGGNLGGGNWGGGGGGGGGASSSGGGGGGSNGQNGTVAQGNTPPKTDVARGGSAVPSGGSGGDGGGGGGGGVVLTSASTNGVDGQAAAGGYGGGGGGGAGTGAFATAYSVQGGSGGVGGGGGGGGVNQSGMTPATGGNSLGGGGGAGGGPSNALNASGGTDIGNLGGGNGGAGENAVGSGHGGGGGGGGSGLGGAIFVDSSLNFTIQAASGVPTTFNTSNNTTQAGTHGTGASGAGNGDDGSALGNSIFLRARSSLTFLANDVSDHLTVGDGVAFIDDTSFGASGGTNVNVTGNGTVVYNGTSNYQGSIAVNNANFKVNGQISSAPVFVCRNKNLSAQRGILSGTGTLTGDVYVNSGTISPDASGTLTLGSLTLNDPDTLNGTLGSVLQVSANSNVQVTGAASLAGSVNVDASFVAGDYTILTAGSITGAFNPVVTGGQSGFTYSLKQVGNSIHLVVANSGGGSSSGCWASGSIDHNHPGDFLLLLTGMYSLLAVAAFLNRKIKFAFRSTAAN